MVNEFDLVGRPYLWGSTPCVRSVCLNDHSDGRKILLGTSCSEVCLASRFTLRNVTLFTRHDLFRTGLQLHHVEEYMNAVYVCIHSQLRCFLSFRLLADPNMASRSRFSVPHEAKNRS